MKSSNKTTFTNQPTNRLPKKVWEKITLTYFGSWESYKKYRESGEKDAAYSAALFFAKQHQIDEDLVDSYVALIQPKKVEVEVIMETENFNQIEIDGLLVPTTDCETTTKRRSIRTHRNESSNRRPETSLEKIQNHLARAIWKVRDINRNVIIEKFDEVENVCRVRMLQWIDQFMSMNHYSDRAYEIKDKLHYPKARLSYWK